jgi:site-specific recombinase XerD
MNDWVYRYLAARVDKTGLVFRFPDGRPLNVPYVSHKFTKYLRAAGFPEEYTFHTLRHTGASWLVQDGVSIYAVQRLLGHSNIQVTMIYSHLVTSEMHESVNRIQIPYN